MEKSVFIYSLVALESLWKVVWMQILAVIYNGKFCKYIQGDKYVSERFSEAVGGHEVIRPLNLFKRICSIDIQKKYTCL
jgi:hypothetical protein